MNINKAIDLLNLLLLPMPDPFDPDYQDALKLGIEALKHIKRAREGDPALDGELLPGETEE